jgi:hypothetical protein
MATSKSALAVALAKRFPGPAGRRNLLRTLGLAADDLAAPAPGGGGGSGGDDRLRALRVEIENALGEMKNLPEGSVAKILATLDKHVRLDKLPDGDPQAEAVREITGDDQLEKFRALLRGAGMTEADIEKAIELGRSGANDRLPLDGTRGGFGGHGQGSEEDRVGRTAMDEAALARAEDGLDQMGFATRRISIGLDYGGLRRPRPAVPAPPTTAAHRADFEKLFPDSARIGV